MRAASFENLLGEKDFDRVWDHLETRFGYSKAWRKECYRYASDRAAGLQLSPLDFLVFCNDKINPLLNAALCEPEHEPTFMRIIYSMFKERIFRGNNIKEP